jgi:hypothetical protein
MSKVRLRFGAIVFQRSPLRLVERQEWRIAKILGGQQNQRSHLPVRNRTQLSRRRKFCVQLQLYSITRQPKGYRYCSFNAMMVIITLSD